MENIQSKDSRLSSLIAMYDMQTTFFISALDGISEKDAQNRLNTKANHIAWLTGSLVQQRFEIYNDLTNGNEEQQAIELFKNNQGIKDGIAYPTLEQFKKDWQHISPKTREALVNADADTLGKKIEMPGMEATLYEIIVFSMYREANCIGQIALWRRILGYEPMKYM